jgi:hypothetical protein
VKDTAQTDRSELSFRRLTPFALSEQVCIFQNGTGDSNKCLVNDEKSEARFRFREQPYPHMTRNKQRSRGPRAAGESGWKVCVGLRVLSGCAAATLSLVVLTGCGDSNVKVYRVVKEEAGNPVVAPGQLPAGHPAVSAAQPRLTWETPAGWTEGKAGDFRLASFTIKGQNGKQADLSVIPLPGVAGGDFANVNRWRGQLGLEAVTAEELKKLAVGVEIAGQPADLYDISGKTAGSDEPTRILGAIQHREGTAWFFKMTGDDQLVAQQKPTLIEFLKTLKMEKPQMEGLPPSHPPIDGSSLPAQSPATASSSEGKPNWEVPAGWSEVPGGQFLVAKFNIAGESNAQAAVNVSMSTGDGGGLLANVNRWRQQLGLSPASETDLAKTATSVEIAGGKATMVDMSGTDARTRQPARIVGAIVPQSGQTWFYKLMGESKLVESQKEAFNRFVQSVSY